MVYAKGFFDLQLRFAARAVALGAMPLEQALLECTHLYARFGCGWDFDPQHPVWRLYLAALKSGDLDEVTYRFYLSRADQPTAPPVVHTCGCFSYERQGEDRIRLHFRSVDPHSPLARERIDARRMELAGLFAQVRRTMEHPPQVIGRSWLYNLEAYRRLFPPSYIATAKALKPPLQRLPLWGQFLDRHGAVKPLAEEFLQRVERAATLDELGQCFPYQVFELSCSAQDFDDHYRIQGRAC